MRHLSQSYNGLWSPSLHTANATALALAVVLFWLKVADLPSSGSIIPVNDVDPRPIWQNYNKWKINLGIQHKTKSRVSLGLLDAIAAAPWFFCEHCKMQ